MTEGLKTIEGQVASINLEKRLMAIEDRKGIIFYSVSWMPNQDQKIQKLKVGYYVKPTVEVKGDSSGRLIDLPYSERPADWPKSNKGGGGKSYAPRNEKLIAFLALHRDAVQAAQITTTPDTQDYDAFMQMCYDRAKKDVEQAMKDFGGA